jgi:hypothetical protein
MSFAGSFIEGTFHVPFNSCGREVQGIEVQFLAGAKHLSLHSVQTTSGSHLTIEVLN